MSQDTSALSPSAILEKQKRDRIQAHFPSEYSDFLTLVGEQRWELASLRIQHREAIPRLRQLEQKEFKKKNRKNKRKTNKRTIHTHPSTTTVETSHTEDEFFHYTTHVTTHGTRKTHFIPKKKESSAGIEHHTSTRSATPRNIRTPSSPHRPTPTTNSEVGNNLPASRTDGLPAISGTWNWNTFSN